MSKDKGNMVQNTFKPAENVIRDLSGVVKEASETISVVGLDGVLSSVSSNAVTWNKDCTRGFKFNLDDQFMYIYQKIEDCPEDSYTVVKVNNADAIKKNLRDITGIERNSQPEDIKRAVSVITKVPLPSC